MSRKALGRLLRAAPAAPLLIVVALGAETRFSRADAVTLRQKVARITQLAQRPAAQPNRTTVTENEVNACLAYDAQEQLPAGVVEPSVTIVGNGRVSARAVVDLDAVRRQRSSRGALDPMSYATGRLPVTATGILTTSNGVGRVALESATIASIPIPKIFLQEIVSYYSRTPEKPGGIGLDDPFVLPARIREIQVQTGHAIVVQ